MKIKKSNIFQLLLASFLAVAFSSCNDWLDVQPKSQIFTDLHFDRESGYRDQLTGIYTKMAGTSLYGGEMTMGLVDVLAQNYDLGSDNSYRYLVNYDYSQSSYSKPKIDAIWTGAYNCIANCNVLLQYINKADSTMFTDNNYYLCKGEALGLRGFLHLDLMRLFAKAPSSNPNAMGVPYVTEYSTSITPQKSVKETMQLVINDLKESVKLLKHDSIYESSKPYNFRTSRRCYFDYYAATITLARAYMWEGQQDSAYIYCKEIMDLAESSENSLPFSFTHRTAIETNHDYECDRTFSTEHLFLLSLNTMADIVDARFNSNAGKDALYPSTTKTDEIYEVTSKGYGIDYRYMKHYAFDGETKYFSKFWQYDDGAYNKMFPLIRMTEAYYMAAEIQKNKGNLKDAINILNTVRSHRNLTLYPLSEDLTAEDIQEEIFKEYRKEFVGEGQLFFYYKRLNLTTIKGAGVTANDNIYVLPMPDNEIEFGNRN